MTLAKPDLARTAAPADPHDDLAGRVRGWYDPDAAAFDLADPNADDDLLVDQDEAPLDDWS